MLRQFTQEPHIEPIEQEVDPHQHCWSPSHLHGGTAGRQRVIQLESIWLNSSHSTAGPQGQFICSNVHTIPKEVYKHCDQDPEVATCHRDCREGTGDSVETYHYIAVGMPLQVKQPQRITPGMTLSPGNMGAGADGSCNSYTDVQEANATNKTDSNLRIGHLDSHYFN